MENVLQKDEFKVLKEHEKFMIEYKSITIFNKNAKLKSDKVSLLDFSQGYIGNCGLIAALAAVSQRPEFLSEIAPKIEHTIKGIKLHFNMFYKGVPTIVTINDKLPFLISKPDDNTFGEQPFMIYARSEQNDNLYIASLFEKAVVKLACFNSYECSVGIDPKFILSIIDDSMTSSCVWLKTDSKQNIIDHIKTEV